MKEGIGFRVHAAFVLSLLSLIIGSSVFGAVAPAVAGNGATDSVYITFASVDTTYYPEVKNLDSIDILRYRPNGSLLDSTSNGAANLLNPTKGFYRAAFRASDGSGTKGIYSFVVRGWRGGKERGAASGTYEVVERAIDELETIISAIKDTLDDGFGSRTKIGDTIHRNASVLTASDNVGVNWADVLNEDALRFFSNTVFYAATISDTAAIARSVWSDWVVDRAARKVGYVDTAGVVTSVPSAGTGAYACSLYYFDASDSSAIQGVFSRVMNASQSSTCAVGITNSEGLFVASLDAASYRVWSYLSGYSFSPLPESIQLVSPASVDTIWGTYFDPGAPSLPSLCRVYGWVRNLSGDGLSGATVSASVRQSPLRHGSTIVSPYLRSTVCDSAGYWYLDLIPSPDLTPATTSYSFSIYYQTGTIGVKDVAVPDTSAWELIW
jgi:hypothetical protein